MSTLLYLFAYLALIVFAIGVASRVSNYLKKPIHVRWELYPVAHDTRASYGGSYLEETDWWTKPRPKSRVGELKVMIPEILLLKAVWEHNRPLWWRTFPFHFGLYLTCGFIGLLVLGAVLQIFGVAVPSSGGIGSAVAALTNLLGPAGFILCIIGAISLFHRRLTDPGLRTYSSAGHFINLALFIAAMVLALCTWMFVDPTFEMARTFVQNLMTFHFAATGSGLFNAMVACSLFLMAYIPLTHMSHFFMKYFLYHDIRWGDEPNVDTPKTDAKIGVVLNYPVTWGASHIAGHGKTTWAEVATFNPMAEDAEAEKE